MKESLSVRFLYGTVLGRFFLKILIDPRISKVFAKYMSSKYSKVIIPWFIKKNGINMDRFIIPKGGYKSFNDFFTRKLKVVPYIDDKAQLISPCDGYLTVKDIDDDSVFEIKHSRYDLRRLLKSKKLSKEFKGGTALIFRLTPCHYHRYDFCADGKIEAFRKIKGVLHCVRPIAVGKLNVFSQNSREYIVMKCDDNRKVIQMEVGAMLVGKIANSKNSEPSSVVKKGEEKGFFEYGGSTIIVLLNEKVKVNRDILAREKVGNEIPVMIGESLL